MENPGLSADEGRGGVPRYYDALGQGHDELLRCKDCRQLVLASTLRKIGCCPCGTRRVVEITTLSEAEHARILSGELDFPYRELFLKEFSGVELDEGPPEKRIGSVV